MTLIMTLIMGSTEPGQTTVERACLLLPVLRHTEAHDPTSRQVQLFVPAHMKRSLRFEASQWELLYLGSLRVASSAAIRQQPVQLMWIRSSPKCDIHTGYSVRRFSISAHNLARSFTTDAQMLHFCACWTPFPPIPAFLSAAS